MPLGFGEAFGNWHKMQFWCMEAYPKHLYTEVVVLAGQGRGFLLWKLGFTGLSWPLTIEN